MYLPKILHFIDIDVCGIRCFISSQTYFRAKLQQRLSVRQTNRCGLIFFANLILEIDL